jgi:hypothetical protein
MDGNNLHIVWNDNRDGNDEIYYGMLDNNGNPMFQDTRITNDLYVSWWPRVAVDASHMFHIVWDDDRYGDRELYYINGDLLTDVGESQNQYPDSYELMQNYPNPFNPVTRIDFSLNRTTEVTLEIFNVLGQHVETLVDGRREVGRYTVSWDGRRAASGVYFYRLTAGEYVTTRKMLLLK